MFFFWVLISILQAAICSLAADTNRGTHQHNHRVLAERPSSTHSYSVAIPTDPGSRVPIEIGSFGLIGIIEIGTPEQTIDVQFDTTFNGVVVQSTYDQTAGISDSNVYNSSSSKSWNPIFSSTPEDTYTQTFDDNAYAIAIAGTETFNVGGKLYSKIPFGQVEQYYQNTSGQSTPFGGASGIIGLNYDSMQQPGLPSFMFAMRDQLAEWKCALDSSRAWQNGSWIFGSLGSLYDHTLIAWADRNLNQPAWSINITAISAGSRKNPPITTWSATVSTEEQSLVWPQQLLDWYFTDIDSTWSALDNTYRYPCNTTLPDFTFGFGNGTFTIPGTYMPYQRDLTGTTCVSIITGDNSTDLDHEYKFGSFWAQLGVLVLDFENMQVGFMNKSTSLPEFTTASLDIIGMN